MRDVSKRDAVSLMFRRNEDERYCEDQAGTSRIGDGT